MDQLLQNWGAEVYHRQPWPPALPRKGLRCRPPARGALRNAARVLQEAGAERTDSWPVVEMLSVDLLPGTGLC